MKKGYWIGVLAVAFLLGGCQGHTKAASTADSTSSSTSNTASTTKSSSKQVKNAASKESAAKAAEPKAAAELWNTDKAQELNSFMASWGQTMGQQYEEYAPGNNVDLYGLQVPDAVLPKTSTGWTVAVNEAPVVIDWSTDGKNAEGYALVAVYSDAATQAYCEQHVYFFTIVDGTPQVLVTMQNQGNENDYLYFSETENAELKAGFEKIVNETGTFSEQSAAGTMDFEQIKAGDYSSLAGDWQEISTGANAHDGTGTAYQTGGQDTLTVTSNLITDTAMKLQKTTLTDNNGSHPITFSEASGVLTASLADADTTPINWSVTFYPKGTTNEFKLATDSDTNSKNLLVIWTSNNSYTEIFAQN